MDVPRGKYPSSALIERCYMSSLRCNIDGGPGWLIARARGCFRDTPARRGWLARRILDATVQEAASCGLRELTIDAVAHRAATTRMTVYRRFGRREQLIEAMAIRETQRFIAALGEAISGVDDVEAQGPEAFIAGLRFMHEHPFTRRAIEVEPEAIIELLEADNGLVFRMGSDFIAERLDVRGLEPAPRARSPRHSPESSSRSCSSHTQSCLSTMRTPRARTWRGVLRQLSRRGRAPELTPADGGREPLDSPCFENTLT